MRSKRVDILEGIPWKKIEEKLNKLPFSLQKEVMDFIDFLLEKGENRVRP